ncbi:unnamed protein product [Dicrocoelium dendriticum]|nr:unnamed protein product [Dicrocoelium dendriticum]
MVSVLVAAGLHASHGQATVMLTYTLPHPTSCSPRQSHMTVNKDARPPSCSKSRKLVSSKYCSVSKRCSVPSSGSSTVGTPRTTRNSRGHSPENAKCESHYEPYVARADSPGSEDCTKTSGKLSNDQPLPVTNAVCARPPSGNRTNGSARRQASRRATTQDKAGAATFGHSQLTTADQSLLRLLSQPGEVDQEKIRQTIKEGANPNCLDSDANTPLVVAVHHRKVEAIPPLVEAGAEVNAAGTL